MRTERDEIESNVRAYIKGAADDEQLLEIMSDYVEECIDEAAPHVCLRVKSESDAAIAIEVYDQMMQAQHKHGITFTKQIAFEVAKGLLHHYDFSLKECA